MTWPRLVHPVQILPPNPTSRRRRNRVSRSHPAQRRYFRIRRVAIPGWRLNARLCGRRSTVSGAQIAATGSSNNRTRYRRCGWRKVGPECRVIPGVPEEGSDD